MLSSCIHGSISSRLRKVIVSLTRARIAKNFRPVKSKVKKHTPIHKLFLDSYLFIDIREFVWEIAVSSNLDNI